MGRPSRISSRWAGPRIEPPTALLLLWSLFIIYGTLLPFHFRFDPAAAAAKLRDLGGALRRPTSRADVVSNVLLFVPWGLFYAFRAAGRGRPSGMAMAGAIFGGLILSGAMEFAQLFLPSRTTSLIDLATNTAGSILGALVGRPLALRARTAWSPRLRQQFGRRPLAACTTAMAIAFIVAGLSPFDVSLDMGSLKGSIRSARPIPFGPDLGSTSPPPEPWAWAREGLTWAFAGGLTLLALREAGSNGPPAVAGVVILCGGLATLIEVAQLAIPARVSDASSVVVAIVGAAAAAAVVGSIPRWTARRWIGPGLTCWASAILLAAWTPPVPAPAGRWPPDWSQFVPFWSYYRRTDIYAVADLLDQMLAFATFGALLAAEDARRAVRRSLLLGLAFGIILEAGQLLLADRTGEITDALSASAGAALGAWLWLLGRGARSRWVGTPIPRSRLSLANSDHCRNF